MTAFASIRFIRREQNNETDIERLWHAIEHLAGRLDIETDRLSEFRAESRQTIAMLDLMLTDDRSHEA